MTDLERHILVKTATSLRFGSTEHLWDKKSVYDEVIFTRS
jgi:hypothetical protein